MKPRHMKVEDLMTTAVISFRETDTVWRAQLEMHLASIRHIPVVDDHDHVIGVVSNRDLLRYADRRSKQLRIGNVMTQMVRTVRPETPAHEAAAMMLEGKFGALPVVGDEQQLVGIVTETDFLAFACATLGGKAFTRAA